jgi:hypothetical protein
MEKVMVVLESELDKEEGGWAIRRLRRWKK